MDRSSVSLVNDDGSSLGLENLEISAASSSIISFLNSDIDLFLPLSRGSEILHFLILDVLPNFDLNFSTFFAVTNLHFRIFTFVLIPMFFNLCSQGILYLTALDLFNDEWVNKEVFSPPFDLTVWDL
ncbi:hypothetical protein WICMUC_001422 [Wickerhamomyces mucosus]|uniref:Uncharacterized protein n=1 Tax=Wickerhamomyces mucosus TaxID=1378264 RepID=A0A9P8PVL2_9ASCO|nr:hypothetical protein WICMUC_001422 [Wickerhamomyces mucosus]